MKLVKISDKSVIDHVYNVTLDAACNERGLDPDDYVLLPESRGESKATIQQAVAEEYGVNSDPASAALSVGGKLGDAVALLVDNMTQDILAVQVSVASDYSKERVRLFDELHGEGSWAKTVDAATQWRAARVSGEIQMPFDDKGIDEVITESAQLGGFVRAKIAELNPA